MNNKPTKKDPSIIKNLFSRKRIPQRSWARVLSEIIGGTHKTAATRIRNEWILSLDELSKIADHFETTIPEILQEGFYFEKIFHNEQRAILKMGNDEANALAVLGESKPKQNDVFSAKTIGGKTIITKNTQSDNDARAVLFLKVETETNKKPTIIILDDDLNSTATLCKFLRIDSDFEIIEYRSNHEVENLIKNNQLANGYVIDWTMEDGSTTKNLIQSIRSIDKKCPIILLTGTIQSEEKNESEIANLVRTCNIDVLIKPFPVSLISEKLKKSIAEISDN